jgi:hypothetical protein
MRAFGIGLAAAAALWAGASFAEEAPARAPADYSKPANWLCLPGRQDACSTDLDAIAVDAKGERTPAPFKAAADPQVDCFYVYPTASEEPSLYSDLTPGPGETRSAESQAARFAAKCRVFAPMYRSITLAALHKVLKGEAKVDFDGPYADVRDAWRRYLARENHGRGVVLIGHSQGSILLERLIAEEIDGKPAQKLLVGAYLAGVPSLVVPEGKDVGGTFKSVPVCRTAGQAGCVVAWSSYAADDSSTPRFFAQNPGKGLVAACVNPAALAGGRARLHGFVRKPPMAPAGDPPWVEMDGQLSAECVSDKDGTVLRVSVEPGAYAELLQGFLDRSQVLPGWGLHKLDVNLVQGDLLDLVDVQSRAWAAGRR